MRKVSHIDTRRYLNVETAVNVGVAAAQASKTTHSLEHHAPSEEMAFTLVGVKDKQTDGGVKRYRREDHQSFDLCKQGQEMRAQAGLQKWSQAHTQVASATLGRFRFTLAP